MNKLTLAILLAMCAFSAQAASITLNGPGSITPGQAFNVTVDATNVFAGKDPATDALIGYGFTVSVGDPAVLSFDGETAGPLALDFTGQDGPVVGGTFLFLAPGDFTEPLTLATLHFTALSSGTSSIAISSDLSDLSQGLAFFSASDNISAQANIVVSPEPGTMLLVLSGLAGCIGAIRVRR